MAELNELISALERADKAGDEDAAKAIALMISELKPRGLAEDALRKAEYVSRGIADSALETIGAIPDLTAAGLRRVGLPAPADPDYYTNALKGGFSKAGQAISAPINAAMPNVMGGKMTEADRVAYGGGRGVADAASFYAPAAIVGKVAKGVTGGVAKTMASQPVLQSASGVVGGTVGEYTDNPYLGMAAAVATQPAASLASRVVTPVRNQLSKNAKRLAKEAEEIGIKLTAGQATASRPLLATESVLATTPFTAGAQQEIYNAQRLAFNRAVLKTAGVNADNAAPEVLDDAFRSLGAKFDDLASQTTVKIDKTFYDDVARTKHNYARRLPTDIKPVFQSYADDINEMLKASKIPGVVGVSIEGAVYKKIASDLRTAARGAKNNPDLQRAINGLSNAIDDAMGRSAGKGVAAAWKDVRGKYRNLLIIDDSMRAGTNIDRMDANIPFSGLKAAVVRSDKSGYSRGRGELNKLSRVGEFLANKIPNSGTPERQQIQNMLSGRNFIIGGGATAVAGVDPGVAALAAAGAYGIPRVAQGVLNSRLGQAYLRNQLIQTPVKPSLEMAGKVALGQSKGLLEP